MSNVVEALGNLELAEYSDIRMVFGKVLRKRSLQPEPNCTLFNWLAIQMHELKLLNEDCGMYVREIGLQDAQRKCNADVLGNVVRPFVDFNDSCGDFWSEMAAIRVLRDKGYCRFHAIHKPLPDGTSSDYEAYRGHEPAYIEVKNIRSNKTVFDVFDEEIRRLHEAEPAQYGFNVAVDYPYVNPPTTEQERRVKSFLNSIRGFDPPFSHEIDLVDATAVVTVYKGKGTALMTRSFGPGSPEPLKKDWFLEKVRAKAEGAYAQMKDELRLRVLVVNFDSPSVSLSEDFIDDACRVMSDVFGGAVDPYLLHYRRLPLL